MRRTFVRVARTPPTPAWMAQAALIRAVGDVGPGSYGDAAAALLDAVETLAGILDMQTYLPVADRQAAKGDLLDALLAAASEAHARSAETPQERTPPPLSVTYDRVGRASPWLQPWG